MITTHKWGSVGFGIHLRQSAHLHFAFTSGLGHSSIWRAAPIKRQQQAYPPRPLWLVEQQGDLLDSSARSLIATPPAMTLTRQHITLSCVICQPAESCHYPAIPPARQMETNYAGCCVYFYFFGVLHHPSFKWERWRMQETATERVMCAFVDRLFSGRCGLCGVYTVCQFYLTFFLSEFSAW